MSAQNQPLVQRETALETLNSLRRGELAAVETYRHAITRMGSDAPEDLKVCLHSHDQRARHLADHIALMGGTPASGSGLWGAFAGLVEGSAALMGKRAVFSTLEEGEDQGLTDYRAAIDRVDAAGLSLLRTHLLPEQIRTHGLMSLVCRRCSMDE